MKERKSFLKRSFVGELAGRMIPKTDWRVRAVVCESSDKFARDLEATLNEAARERFDVAHFFFRADDGIVVIFQRTEYIREGDGGGKADPTAN